MWAWAPSCYVWNKKRGIVHDFGFQYSMCTGEVQFPADSTLTQQRHSRLVLTQITRPLDRPNQALPPNLASLPHSVKTEHHVDLGPHQHGPMVHPEAPPAHHTSSVDPTWPAGLQLTPSPISQLSTSNLVRVRSLGQGVHDVIKQSTFPGQCRAVNPTYPSILHDS